MAPKDRTNATLPIVHHKLLATARAKGGPNPTRVPLNTPKQTTPLTVRPVVPPSVPAKVGPRRPALRAIADLASGQAHAQSRNWSGVVVPATGGKRFSLITASWKVPHVTKPSNREHSYISIWIGLGGSYRASRSMPQMGSEHGWDGATGTAVNRLWCQWWLGAENSAGYLSHYIDVGQASLLAGDTITCWLEVDPGGITVKYHWRWTRNNTTTDFCAEDTRGVPVMADTANWIVERPTEVIVNAKKPSGYELGGHHPLPVIHAAGGGILPSGDVAATMEDCIARLGPGGADELVRQPIDGQLVSLRSIVPGSSRSFVELEPAIPVDRSKNRIDIVRHLP